MGESEGERVGESVGLVLVPDHPSSVGLVPDHPSSTHPSAFHAGDLVGEVDGDKAVIVYIKRILQNVVLLEVSTNSFI